MLQNNFERAFGGWHIHREFYGDAIRAEATLIPTKKDFYLGVGLNIGFEGAYQLRITDKSVATTGTYTLFLVKRTNVMNTVASVSVKPKGCEMQIGQPMKLCLQYKKGTLYGYLNEELLLTYDDNRSEACYETGYCGVWIHPERAAQIVDFQCDGTRKVPPQKEKKPKSDKCYVMNTADTDKEGRLPYWSSVPYTEEWKVRDGSYCSGEHCKDSMTHLHVFERNPQIQMKAAFSGEGEAGSCGVLLRHAPKTAYVKVGYDRAKQCWFIEDTPALYDCRTKRFESERFPTHEGLSYDINIATQDEQVTLSVDGKILIQADGVRQIGFGRIGLFAERMKMQVFSFRADTPYAADMIDGVIKTFIDETHIGASTEIEEAPNGDLVAVSKVMFEDSDKTGIYYSKDKGLHFEAVKRGEAYSGLDTKGCYQSIVRLKNGKYMQVLLAENLKVQISDDLIGWKDVGWITNKEAYPGSNFIYHTSSLVEYTDMYGKSRVFMPIVLSKKVMVPETKMVTVQHDTVVFYSDDEGRNWKASDTSTAQIMEQTGHSELLSYAECKIVQCVDQSLRLYNSRNDTPFICYSESFDFGVTWQGLHMIKELQCAKSSCAFCEDPYEKGTYYMAWVNDAPLVRGDCNGRTRLSLARSHDGKEWNYLGDAEYMSLRFADKMPHLYVPLFQILDPSITVTADYVYLTYGISMYSAKDAKPGDAKMVHHIQRPALARFEKRYLKEQPWNAANICNTFLLEKGEEVTG